jgi:2-polyprenyl-3-methyl-5-hydroxy-6-metoxy-1,4-benzoquinol methylase
MERPSATSPPPPLTDRAETALTDKAHWNQYWGHVDRTAAAKPISSWERAKRGLRNLVGSRRLDYLTRTYSDFVLWDSLYPHFLGDKRGQSILEIGSAPGEYLLRFHRTFGLEPYGVEYAEEGYRQQQHVFEAAGIPAGRVIFADAFSDSFVGEHAARYDIVYSRGVIEHFDDPSAVIEAHVKLAKPGGLLVLTIPNYRHLNWLLKRVFDGESLPGHNLNTMDPAVFRHAFENHGLRQIYCAHYGSIDLSVSQPHKRSGALWLAYLLCEKAQLPLNLALRSLFGGAAPNSRYTSPFLIYVGQKRRI